MPPINTVLLCHGLKLSDLPVERIAPHGDEQLRCRVHARYDTAGNINAQAWGRVLLWGERQPSAASQQRREATLLNGPLHGLVGPRAGTAHDARVH